MPKGLFTAIFLFLAILLLFLVWPKYQELSGLKVQQRLKLTQLEEIENYFSNLGQASQKLKVYQEALEKIDTALPQNPEASRLLNFLAKTSANNGLLLVEIGSLSSQVAQPKQQPAKEGEIAKEEMILGETSFSLKLLGDYPSFKNFLSLLEKSARLIEVETISFSSTRAGLFQFDLNLKVRSY